MGESQYCIASQYIYIYIYSQPQGKYQLDNNEGIKKIVTYIPTQILNTNCYTRLSIGFIFAITLQKFVFTARPKPDFSKLWRPTKNTSSLTRPAPFTFHTEIRGEKHTHKWEKEVGETRVLLRIIFYTQSLLFGHCHHLSCIPVGGRETTD